MAVIKCKMCGGELNFTGGATVAECEYCGSKQTVPSQDSEKKLTLFARADRLRRACEFDKAAGVYESIVADFPEEAEAYWGLVLCRYGIEYVDDPRTGKKVPTCHRSSFDSILEDADFDQACENADAVARRVYRDEAKAIEDIRRGILEVSGKEAPYDIFICYKETDGNGSRTIDSVIAQDVYDALTGKGYRVFFSRISLEDKLGTEYEPYIFAALNSAKIMLVFGTDFEHFNAVWVKNEWSRFLSLISAGQKKTLIPCYKGVDAYDMPKEFQRLQAQDMGKVGAIQDLLRGIDKILGKGAAAPVKETVVVQQSAASAALGVEPLLKRGCLALEDGEWRKADEFFEQVLNLDPENGDAYAGKLCAGLKYRSLSAIAQDPETWGGTDGTSNGNYKKVLRYGSQALKAEIGGYIAAAVDLWKEDTYTAACKAMDETDYQTAMGGFNSIKGYRDADEKSAECARLIEEIYVSACSAMDAGDDQTAMKQFARIQGYRDVAARQLECGRKRAALASGLISAGGGYTIALKSNGALITTLDTEATEDARDLKTWTNIAEVSAGDNHVIGLKADGTVAAAGINKNGQCNVQNWRNIVAISTGESHTVGLKADGTVVATHSDFYRGDWRNIVAVSAGDGCTAALKSDGTVAAAGWLDAKGWTDIVAVSAGKSHAVGLKADGTVVAAGSNENGKCNVGNWTNIVAVSAGMNQTVGLKADGTVVSTRNIDRDILNSWTDIVAVFTSSCAHHIVGLKSDGIVVAGSPIFSDDGCKAQGWKLFHSLESLKQERDMAKRRQEEERRRLEAEYRRQTELKRQQAEQKRRQEEEQQRQAKRRQEEERQQQEKRKRRNRTIRIAAVIIVAVLAAASYLLSKNHQREQYARAAALLEAGSYDEAAAIFKELGDYSDAKEQAFEARYKMAEKLLETGKYGEAAAAFDALGAYSDAEERISAAKYQEADALLKAGNESAAAMAFGALGSYQDAQTRSFAIWNEIAVRDTISAGNNHAVGLKSDGTVVAVGDNGKGQCNVESWTDIIAVSAGTSHTVGLKADGTVVAVGENQSGQCNVEDWTDIVAVAAGGTETIGLKSDGTVVAVGYHQDKINGWTNVTAISAGGMSIAGLKADGTVVTGGYYSLEEDWTDIVAISVNHDLLGLKADGTVQMARWGSYWSSEPESWTDIAAVSAGFSHSVGLRSDGTAVAAGGYGVHKAVESWTNIVAISAGTGYTVGLKADGTVVADGAGYGYGYIKNGISDWTDIKLPNG